MRHDDVRAAKVATLPRSPDPAAPDTMSVARKAATFWGPPLLVATAAALLLPADWNGSTRLLSAWNLALVVALARSLTTVVRTDPARARAHARATDPGNLGLLLISLLVSAASVFGAVFVLADPNPTEDAAHAVFTVAQVVFAIFGGWTVMQIAFTFHYARLYYARTSDGLDLRFPDDVDPDDLDFAYFAFGVGVAFQVSDVAVTTRAMRRAVLVHSVLSFAFNAAILALMVNLLAGRI